MKSSSANRNSLKVNLNICNHKLNHNKIFKTAMDENKTFAAKGKKCCVGFLLALLFEITCLFTFAFPYYVLLIYIFVHKTMFY